MNASREIIKRDERNENLQSFEMIAKMTKAFGVTAYFLIGEGENTSYSQPIPHAAPGIPPKVEIAFELCSSVFRHGFDWPIIPKCHYSTFTCIYLKLPFCNLLPKTAER